MKELLEAIRVDDLKTVRELLQRDIIKTQIAETPLWRRPCLVLNAIALGRLEILRELLRIDAVKTKIVQDSSLPIFNPLINAINFGHREIVRELLKIKSIQVAAPIYFKRGDHSVLRKAGDSGRLDRVFMFMETYELLGIEPPADIRLRLEKEKNSPEMSLKAFFNEYSVSIGEELMLHLPRELMLMVTAYASLPSCLPRLVHSKKTKKPELNSTVQSETDKKILVEVHQPSKLQPRQGTPFTPQLSAKIQSTQDIRQWISNTPWITMVRDPNKVRSNKITSKKAEKLTMLLKQAGLAKHFKRIEIPGLGGGTVQFEINKKTLAMLRQSFSKTMVRTSERSPRRHDSHRFPL